MSPINKFEATGIFVSVAIMAIAIVLIRDKTDAPATTALVETSQPAIVAVSQSESSDGDLEKALLEASAGSGSLTSLVVDDVVFGSGAKVKDGDTVSVHYIGSTRDGVQFDNSYLRGAPFEFTVGEGRVIEGWEKGLVGMQAGGQRMLVIPAEMAYGNRQVGPIAANSILVFAIELLEIK